MSLELELDSCIINIEAHLPVLAPALLAGYQLHYYQLLHAAKLELRPTVSQTPSTKTVISTSSRTLEPA